jgi:hypothetical protein
LRILEPITAGKPALPPAAELHPLRAPSRFAPDLALSLAVVGIVYLLLSGGASLLFRDADAGWHLRAGERILATHSLPTTDPFSFSKAGAPWMAWEWIADVVTGAAHQAVGLSGVALLYLLAIGAGIWMWVRLNWAVGGNFLLTCLFAAPMLATTGLHWLARPHVFGWLFLVATIWFCESRGARTRACRVETLLDAFCIASLSALWANIHGSFILAPAIFVIYAAGAALRPLIWGGERGSAWRSYLRCAAAAAIGSLLNPHGWNLHRHIATYLTDSALLDRIAEFQSFNFHAEGAPQIILMLFIAIAGGLAALSARQPARFLLAIAITAASLRTARMLPIAALILLPLANGSISDVLTHAQFAPAFRKRLDAILNYGSSLRALDKTLSGLALLPVIAIALFGIIRATHPAFPSDQFPVAASASIAALPSDAKLFASDKFGGYLIYRFNGQRKVYFDGRSDFYGADFLKAYSKLIQARPGWQSGFARQGFSHALLPPDSALVSALESSGWRAIYRDKTAVLLKGPQS